MQSGQGISIEELELSPRNHTVVVGQDGVKFEMVKIGEECEII